MSESPATLEIPPFDELPPAGAWWVRLRYAVIVGCIGGLAVFLRLRSLTGVLIFLVAALLALILVISRLVLGCIRHTRVSLLELMALTGCSSLVFGLPFILLRPTQYPGDNGPMVACIALGSFLLILFWHGVFVGIRLAMWMHAQQAWTRLGFILLGILGWPSHFLWRITLPLGVLLFGLGFLFSQLDTDSSNPIILYGVVSAMFGGICLGVAKLHQTYRRKAQENYLTSPDALGPGGDLRTHMPAQTRSWGLFR